MSPEQERLLNETHGMVCKLYGALYDNGFTEDVREIKKYIGSHPKECPYLEKKKARPGLVALYVAIGGLISKGIELGLRAVGLL